MSHHRLQRQPLPLQLAAGLRRYFVRLRRCLAQRRTSRFASTLSHQPDSHQGMLTFPHSEKTVDRMRGKSLT